MSDATTYRLVNPEFDFEFMGQTYRVRKANLDKAIQYQKKIKELSEAKDDTPTLSIVAFCIYIVLKDKVADLTEDVVRQNVSADVDPLDVLTTLGFISPDKKEKVRIVEEAITKKATS